LIFFCIACDFSSSFQILFQLCLEEKVLLKLSCLIDMNNSVPACAYINRKVEQVLILQNQFCQIGEKCFVKSPIRSTIVRSIFRIWLCFYNKYHFYSLFSLQDVLCLWINLFKWQHRNIYWPSEWKFTGGYHLYLQTDHPVYYWMQCD
jgi:hypothetical protein